MTATLPNPDDPSAISITHTFIESTNRLTADDGSDYGDFGNDEEELEIVEQLLTQVASKPDEHESLLVIDIEDYEPPRGVRLPKVLGVGYTCPWETGCSPSNTQILLDFQDTSFVKRYEPENGTAREESPSVEPETQAREPDTRSPLERFRRAPKKALSVTDLVSPAWCELQYFYTLSKHGRKKRTPAMKQGTKVHERLEAEIHITVPVDVTKREDSWGLRIWNIIQGLRTLRDTGQTRELEVWGTVGGEIVNGIIDEVSYECPDPKLEEQVNAKNGNSIPSPVLPEYQTSIADFFQSGAQKENGHSMAAALTSAGPSSLSDAARLKQKQQRIYITDVKTRGSSSLPSGSSVKPTILQLHLYHHMLENLAQGNFALVQLAERYNLNINETFSDSFVAQIGSLNQELFETASSQDHDEPLPMQILSSQGSMDILLQHNNLSTLWEYMISQCRQTFLLPFATSPTLDETPTPTPQSVCELPPPSAQPTRLSPVLTAEYLSSSRGNERQLLGRKSFLFNPDFLKSYLEDTLSWWRGEREARGVELREAWKCRNCDFRDDCEWIHERDKAALEEVLERKRMRQVAGVEGGVKSMV